MIACFVLFGFKAADEDKIVPQKPTTLLLSSLKQKTTPVSNKINNTKDLFKDNLNKVEIPSSTKQTKEKPTKNTTKGISSNLLNMSKAYNRVTLIFMGSGQNYAKRFCNLKRKNVVSTTPL